VESLLLDPDFLVIVNHDSGNGDTGFLVLDGLFVSLCIGQSIGVVSKWEVGGIGSASSGNHISCHFLVK